MMKSRLMSVAVAAVVSLSGCSTHSEHLLRAAPAGSNGAGHGNGAPPSSADTSVPQLPPLPAQPGDPTPAAGPNPDAGLLNTLASLDGHAIVQDLTLRQGEVVLTTPRLVASVLDKVITATNALNVAFHNGPFEDPARMHCLLGLLTDNDSYTRNADGTKTLLYQNRLVWACYDTAVPVSDQSANPANSTVVWYVDALTGTSLFGTQDGN